MFTVVQGIVSAKPAAIQACFAGYNVDEIYVEKIIFYLPPVQHQRITHYRNIFRQSYSKNTQSQLDVSQRRVPTYLVYFRYFNCSSNGYSSYCAPIKPPLFLHKLPTYQVAVLYSLSELHHTILCKSKKFSTSVKE